MWMFWMSMSSTLFLTNRFFFLYRFLKAFGLPLMPTLAARPDMDLLQVLQTRKLFPLTGNLSWMDSSDSRFRILSTLNRNKFTSLCASLWTPTDSSWPRRIVSFTFPWILQLEHWTWTLSRLSSWDLPDTHIQSCSSPVSRIELPVHSVLWFLEPTFSMDSSRTTTTSKDLLAS